MVLEYELLVQLCDEGQLDCERLNRMEGELRPVHHPDAEKQADTKGLYSHAFMAFALATIEKRNSGYAYGERVRELVGNAHRSLVLFRQALGDNGYEAARREKPDIDLFEGRVGLELFRIAMTNGDHEQALFLLTDAMYHIVEFSRNSRTIDSENVPRLTDLEPEEAVRCFERLKVEPTKVKGWKAVKGYCENIHHWWGDCGLDYDEEVAAPMASDSVWDYRYTAGEYWAHAVAFAESRLTPDQLRELREAEQREHAQAHMRLFFGDCWDTLPEGAKDALLQADTLWWSRSPSSRSSVVDNLWKAAVEIVKENLWGPFVGYVRSQPVKELPTAKVLDIDAQPGWEPGLNNFIQLMWRHPRFGDFLRAMNVSPEQTKFLTDLETQKQLKRLNELRNRSVHPSNGTTIEHHEVSGAYRTFLGVGCKGILPRLARLKQ